MPCVGRACSTAEGGGRITQKGVEVSKTYLLGAAENIGLRTLLESELMHLHLMSPQESQATDLSLQLGVKILLLASVSVGHEGAGHNSIITQGRRQGCLMYAVHASEALTCVPNVIKPTSAFSGNRDSACSSDFLSSESSSSARQVSAHSKYTGALGPVVADGS
jgi:hypothetical protein